MATSRKQAAVAPDEPRASDMIKGGGNQSLARGLQILGHLGRDNEGIGVRDLARQLDLSPSITHRLVKTLTEFGFLEQDAATQRYRIGHRAFEVGNTYLKYNSLETVAPAIVKPMAQEHQMNAFIGVMRGRHIIYTMVFTSSAPVAVTSAPGTRAPLHTLAQGKAILADQPDDAILELLGPEPYAQFTPTTITRGADFLRDVAECRRRGYATGDGEFVPGVFNVGAAIRDRSGAAIAALSGSVPRHLHRLSDTPKLARPIVEAAQKISRALGAP
ncbi:IclR family transcriptional regulator [Ramlibacter tataouinensis]|uniref:IclR family transcriptional regulator n=1 Tax=Ramlibacter tataouinensis TaxID=94132 RepID=UPI0022F3959B|nr:IclR family transcriptional regulator [Ramlibacter tataouinensis]WBY00543.1 IclR family transcriptional regulator [Ramlibacter tataouinensis]